MVHTNNMSYCNINISQSKWLNKPPYMHRSAYNCLLFVLSLDSPINTRQWRHDLTSLSGYHYKTHYASANHVHRDDLLDDYLEFNEPSARNSRVTIMAKLHNTDNEFSEKMSHYISSDIHFMSGWTFHVPEHFYFYLLKQ